LRSRNSTHDGHETLKPSDSRLLLLEDNTTGLSFISGSQGLQLQQCVADVLRNVEVEKRGNADHKDGCTADDNFYRINDRHIGNKPR
jgi:hypothetical protein